MKGKVNRDEARESEVGLGYGATWPDIAHKSDGGFRFDTPQLAAGSFILLTGNYPSFFLHKPHYSQLGHFTGKNEKCSS